MNNKKRIVIPLVLMIILISSLISNSELGDTPFVDIVQLVAVGILLGFFIANLKTIFWNKK